MPSQAPLIGRHVRFTCPHCGKVNKAPLTSIGRGGSCCRCGGGVKVPAMHVPVMVDVSVHAPRAPAVLAARSPTLGQVAGSHGGSVLIEDGEGNGDLAILDDPETSTDLIANGHDDRDPGESVFSPTQSIRLRRAATVPSAQTLQQLGTLVNETCEGDGSRRVRLPRAKPSRTPWWAWLIHLGLSASTLGALGMMYKHHAATSVPAADDGPARAMPVAEVESELVITSKGQVEYWVTRSTKKDGLIIRDRTITPRRPDGFPARVTVRDLRE